MKNCRRIRKAVLKTRHSQPSWSNICLLALPAGVLLELSKFWAYCTNSTGLTSVSPEFVERVMSGLGEREEEQPKAWFGLEVMRWAAV